MVNTDSDSESERFESAEESLEEEEEIERKTRSKKNSRESESEVAEPVVSNNDKDNETVLAENVSPNLSYRKRPERVKHKPSIPSQKVNSRNKKFNETVFNTDVADVFFQDITSNLSKNINKSLHTLQLKSSNVKGLILNSLPTTSAYEEGNFVYDDSLSISPLYVDNKILSNEASDGERVFTYDCISETPKFLPTEKKETDVLDNPNSQNSDVDMLFIRNETSAINTKDNLLNKESVPVLDSETNLLKNTEIEEKTFGLNKLKSDTVFVYDQNSKLATVTDNKKEGSINTDECLDKSCDQASTVLELKNKKSFEDQENNVSLDQPAINISFKNNLNINKFESEELKNNEDAELNFPSKIVPSSVVTKIEDSDVTASLLVQNYSDSLINQEFYVDLTNKEAELSLDCKTIPLQNKKNKNEDCKTKLNKEVKTINKNNERYYTRKADCNNIQEQKSASDLKNNDDGINADEEIVIRQNEIKGKNLTIAGETPEIDFNIKENSSKHSDVSNGWDDFDFSDNEIEGVNSEGVNKCAILNKPKDSGDMRVKHTLTGTSDFAENNINTNFKPQEVKKYLKEENVIDKKWEEKETSKKDDIDEGWDWESWEDEIDDIKEKERKSLCKTSLQNDKPENIPDSRSKWSGWDSFNQKIEEKQGNWNLGTWGVNLLLNKATAVTQGISNVLEAGLGAPDPETLARIQKEEERQHKQQMEKIKMEEPKEISKKNSTTSVNLFPVSGITNLVAGVTSKIVEHTKIQEIGSKVLTGGLDTLETFGKKTMEVLQDGDPGLRNKRALLTGNNKPVLSQILREVREKADKEIKQAEEKALAKKCHFETLFDDFQGMVHLEALEMLSRQYELKLEQLKDGMSLEELEDLEGILEEVEQLCALDDLDTNSVFDFRPALQMAIEPLKEEISIEKLIQIHDNANKWLETASQLDTSQTLVHQKVVSTVAELTAATVHEFLKAGELLSIKECRKTVDEIDALAKFTNVLCMEIDKVCEKFILVAKNKSKGELDSANMISEKVIIMKNNSTSYIKQAFNLLIPVLQAGAAL